MGEKTLLPAHLSHTIRRLFSPLLPHILREVSPLILVVLAFVAFVLYNGGVTVGDKTNHKPSFHPMQAYPPPP